MTELRYTDTNASDDSAGRAFGLEGNLYLPLVVAGMGAVSLFALAALVLRFAYLTAGMIAGVPLALVVAWVFCLRHGKPAGYDRDWIEYALGDRHFTRRLPEGADCP